MIWAIPPLSPQQSDLHFIDNNSTHIPPSFKIPLPDDILRHSHEILGLMTVSSWYFGSGSSESVYFDFFYTSKIQKFKIIIKPDLSYASLHVINRISELISDDLITSLGRYSTCKDQICEDALVYLRNIPSRKTLGGYAGLILTSAPSFNVVMQWNGSVESICPASGRFVYWPRCRDGERTFSRSRIVVIDLF